MNKRSGLKRGDLFSITTASGHAFIHYVDKRGKEPPLVRVLPGLYPVLPENLAEIAAASELYYVHLFSSSFKEEEVHYLGNFSIPPGSQDWPTVRHGPFIEKTGSRSWDIVSPPGLPGDISRANHRRVTELSADEQQLSIYRWMHLEGLLRILESGWTPKSEQ